MKTINKYRQSNRFFITGMVLEYMVQVRSFIATLPNVDHLIGMVAAEEGVAEDRIDLYTVRVTTKNHAIYDLLVEASTHTRCRIIDQVCISGELENF